MVEVVLEMCAVRKDLVVVNNATRSIERSLSTEDNHCEPIVSNANGIEILLHSVHKMQNIFGVREICIAQTCLNDENHIGGVR